MELNLTGVALLNVFINFVEIFTFKHKYSPPIIKAPTRVGAL
jgi:hypothetical protein